MANLKDYEIKIPNLGEAEETAVIELSVNVGDKVNINDPLIVLESEKAAMEIPSDYDGTIKEIKVSEGQNVKEGMVFAIVESVEKNDTSEVEKPIEPPKNVAKNLDETIQIDFSGINAGPAVRKIARELEINLKNINGTGKNGLITKDDLKTFVHSGNNQIKQELVTAEELRKYGEVRVEKQTKIRALGAKNLHKSWISIPHVTHFEEVDITVAEEQRKNLNQESSVKLTPLAYIIKFCCIALKEFPYFNSSLLDENQIALRENINLGLAVDAEDGLVVPVIKDADCLSLDEIAQKIIELSEKVKNKKIFNKDLEGATFTISSLGNQGGTGFTPIINQPEVAILGVSRAKKILNMNDGEIVEKTILPISISYDHRVINGADAGRFMNFLKNEIEKGL